MNGSDKMKIQYFLNDYVKSNPMYVFLYMLLTLGFYFLIWIYDHNKRFEQIHSEAPDSKRGFIILFGMPILWYFITLVAKLIFFEESGQFIYYVSLFGWVLIALLSLKYLYDFCKVFGEFTNTNGIWWYFLIYPGYFSVILFFLGFNYTIALVLCPLISIPMMQNTLNEISDKTHLKFKSDEFNAMTRKY